MRDKNRGRPGRAICTDKTKSSGPKGRKTSLTGLTLDHEGERSVILIISRTNKCLELTTKNNLFYIWFAKCQTLSNLRQYREYTFCYLYKTRNILNVLLLYDKLGLSYIVDHQGKKCRNMWQILPRHRLFYYWLFLALSDTILVELFTAY